jgi:hypothetical protein
VRYELNSYILFGTHLVFNGLNLFNWLANACSFQKLRCSAWRFGWHSSSLPILCQMPDNTQTHSTCLEISVCTRWSVAYKGTMRCSENLWECLFCIPTGEDLVPESSVQDETGAAREGLTRSSRAPRGRRSHYVTVSSQSGSSCIGKGREAVHGGCQGTAATPDWPTYTTPPPGDALVLAPSHTPSPSTATSPRLVVVTVSFGGEFLPETLLWNVAMEGCIGPMFMDCVCVNDTSLAELLQEAKEVDTSD